jgi:hypothetical protein
VSNSDRLMLLVLGALVLAAKLPTMATPYYWDERVWISLVHNLVELPLWRALPGCHPPELFGRPPGLYLPTAAVFKLSGASPWVSHLVICGFAILGVWFTYRLAALLYGTTAGVLAALFILFDALYFAQAGMFLADLPVAATGVASVYWALRRRYVPYLLFAVWVVSIKETGMAIVFAISVYVLLTERRRGLVVAARQALPWAVPMLLMSAYYAAQWATSGGVLIQPHDPIPVFQPHLADIYFRLITHWLFVAQNRWIFIALIAANLLAHPAARRRPQLLLFGLIVLCSGYAFTVLYYLPRYLLPVMPYLYVLAAGALLELFPRRAVHGPIAVALLLLSAASLRGVDRPGTREWDLGYLAAVRTYSRTATRLERDYADARIVALAPMSSYLRKPQLGYVSRPLQVFSPNDARFDSSARFDVVVDCILSFGDRDALSSYIDAHGLNAVDRFEEGSFRCDVYDAQGLTPEHQA